MASPERIHDLGSRMTLSAGYTPLWPFDVEEFMDMVFDRAELRQSSSQWTKPNELTIGSQRLRTRRR